MSDLTDAIEAAAPRLTVALWNLAHGRGHAVDRPQIAVGATEPDGGSATKDDTRNDRQEQRP